MATRVRYANAGDIDWMVEQLRAFDKFAAYGRSLIEDEVHARIGILGLMQNHVVFLAEDEWGNRMGFIAGYRTQHPFNPRIRMLTECFWWVAESHRRSRAGAILLKEFITYGRRYCDWVVMSLENVSPVKPGSLERLGFKAKESSFLLEVA